MSSGKVFVRMDYASLYPQQFGNNRMWVIVVNRKLKVEMIWGSQSERKKSRRTATE